MEGLRFPVSPIEYPPHSEKSEIQPIQQPRLETAMRTSSFFSFKQTLTFPSLCVLKTDQQDHTLEKKHHLLLSLRHCTKRTRKSLATGRGYHKLSFLSLFTHNLIFICKEDHEYLHRFLIYTRNFLFYFLNLTKHIHHV